MSLTLLAASAAIIGLADDPMADARAHVIGTSPPVAGLSVGNVGDLWRTIAVYSFADVSRPLADGRFPRLWIARHSVGNSQGQVDVSWTDSRTCPALMGVLAWMGRLQPPRIEPDGLLMLPEDAEGQPGPLPPSPDGGRASYTIWGTGRDANNEVVTVAFEGQSQLIADFGDAALLRLQPCWREEAPDSLKALR